MKNKTIKAKKGMSLIVLSSVALLAGLFSMPLYHAYAACSKSSGSTTATNSASYSSSVSANAGSSTLVCVSRTSALSTLGLDSASEKNGKSSKKTTICHIPPGNPDQKMTLSVGSSSVPAHLDHGDSLGSCSDLQAQTSVEALPSCTALGGGSTEPGVWLPESTLGNGSSLNAYLAQVQGGFVTGQPDSSASSYREISGQ